MLWCLSKEVSGGRGRAGGQCPIQPGSHLIDFFGEVEAVVFVFCAGQDYWSDWCPHEDLLSNLDQLKGNVVN